MNSIHQFPLKNKVDQDKTKPIFGLHLFKKTERELMKKLHQMACNSTKKTVFFVNAHTVNTMFHRPGFLDNLQRADFLLPDGIGIEIAAKYMGDSFAQNLCGTDLIQSLCRSSLRLFLLGGTEGTSEKAAETFKKRWGANIVGTHHGFIQNDPESQTKLFQKIKQSKANILLVGMGVPIQEEWILQHRSSLDIPIAMGVGGLFDYYSGNVQRAPEIWRKARVEWLYRMTQEPKRLWKRYIVGNPMFLYRLVTSSSPRLNHAKGNSK